MEYTLEGHGYSIARVMRNALHAEGLSGPEMGFADAIIAQIETLPGHPAPDLTLVARTLRDMWRTARSRTAAGRARPQDAPDAVEGGNGGDFTVEAPPELLSMLRALLPHGPMEGVAFRAAAAAKAVFDKLGLELGEGPQVSLCSIEKSLQGDEHLRLAAHWPTRDAEIRPGDPVSCGVLIVLHRDRTGGYHLEALPRVHRAACQNGMVMPCKNAAIHKVDPRLLFDSSDDLSALTAALEQATCASLDSTVFERAVERCRRSANEVTGPSATPLASLLESRLRPQVILAVHRRYAMAHNFTRWGMINAVTAEARTASAGLMLTLERLGGELADAAPSTPAPRRASSPSIAAVRASLEDAVRRTAAARPPKKVTED